MNYLITALLLTASPACAHHVIEAEQLTGSEICAALTDELEHSVSQGLITMKEANKLIIRCYVNYG